MQNNIFVDSTILLIKQIGIHNWVNNVLAGDENLYFLSNDITYAISNGWEIDGPIAVVKDRLIAYISNERKGAIRKVQKQTIDKLKSMELQNNYVGFLGVLRNGFVSELHHQVYQKNKYSKSYITIYEAEWMDYSSHEIIELCHYNEDAVKLSKTDPPRMKTILRKFWQENFGKEDYDDNWFAEVCLNFGFEINQIIQEDQPYPFSVEQTAGGNRQLVFMYDPD